MIIVHRFIGWLAVVVVADLPLHCLLKDAAGDWEFQLGRTDVHMNNCGHSVPNTVESMLVLNRTAAVQPFQQTLRLRLTQDIAVREGEDDPSRNLKMLAEDLDTGEKGFWTMVFDTGFEVRIRDISMMYSFDFSLLPGVEIGEAATGDSWTKIGTYEGRSSETKGVTEEKVYACHCDQTSAGWVRVDRKFACGIGDKVSKEADAQSFASLNKDGSYRKWRRGEHPPNATGNTSTAESVGTIRKAQPDTHVKAAQPVTLASQPSVEIAAQKKEKPEKVRAEAETAAAKAVPAPPPRRLRGNSSNANKSQLIGGAHGTTLPKKFDWRDELHLMPDALDGIGDEFDQGACGSCWAFTTATTFQARLRIGIWKKYGVLVPLQVNWPTLFQCNPYGEGCSGGWNLQAARFLVDVGLPEMFSGASEAARRGDQSCDWRNVNASERFYAKDYGYVGGFSHGATEESMMVEVMNHGPIAISINTNAVPDFWSGNFGEPITKFKNEEMPREQFSDSPGVKPWYYTTHAVVLVGWGEELTDDGEELKYWIIRNSWGRTWGDKGYGYVRRGYNDAATEASAVWIDADVDHLPPQFKKTMHERIVPWGKQGKMNVVA
jgi:cathepsin C